MTALIHALHVGLVAVGLLVVLALLRPEASNRAGAARLRRLAGRGELVSAAENRARRLLGRPTSRRPAAALAAAALGSVGAAAVHALVTPEHFTEGWRFGVFFTVLSVVQITWAVALVSPIGTDRRLVGGAVVLNVAVVVLWIATRTVGLPWGLAEVESVGLPDALAGVAEAVVIGGCVVQLARHAARAGAPLDGAPTSAADAGSRRSVAVR